MRLEGTKRRIARLGVVVAALAAPSAHAQPKTYDAEQASIDFAGGSFDAACKYFVDAAPIAPSEDFQTVKHAIDQFACFVRGGLAEKAAGARASLDAYYQGKPEPEEGKAPAHYKARFRTYATALDKAGPRLAIALPEGPAPGAITVTRVGAGPLGGSFDAPRFVDVGAYDVVVKRDDATFTAHVEVANPFADGKLEHDAPPVVAHPVRVATDATHAPDIGKPLDPKPPMPTPPAPARGSAAPGIALLVTGGVLAATGAVLLGVAGAKAGEIPASCDTETRSCANDADTATANDASAIGQPLLGAGIAGLAVGVSAGAVGAILLAIRPGSGSGGSAVVVPWIDGRTVGFVAGGAW